MSETDDRRVKVLVAEDNGLSGELLQAVLETKGIESELAFDGREAVSKFQASEPDTYDAILMDVEMPLMDGYEAARTIRASKHVQSGSIPIIAMTANDGIEDIQAARANGMDGHIAKPIDVDRLAKLLTRGLENETK